MVNLVVKIDELQKSSIISAQVADSPSATSRFYYIPLHSKKSYQTSHRLVKFFYSPIKSYKLLLHTKPNGMKYEGGFKGGDRSGKGIITTPDGCKFVGNFKNDQAEGHGKIIFKNGDVSEGEWKEGERDIQVTYTWPSGEKYVGEYVNDSIDGQGTYAFPCGEKYEGRFKDGQYHGQGTLTLPDGSKSVGEFKDDDPWNVKDYDKEETNNGKIVNGVEQIPKTNPIIPFELTSTNSSQSDTLQVKSHILVKQTD